MRARRLLIIFLAFYLTFLGGGSYYALFFPVRVAHHIIVTLLALLWLLGRLRKGRGLPRTPLDLPLAFALGAWLLATVFSMDMRMSLEHLWFALVHTLAFIYLVERIKRGDQRLLLDALFIMAAIVVFFSSLEVASWLFGLGIVPGTEVGWLAVGRLPNLSELPIVSLALSITTLQAGYVAPLIMVCVGWALSTQRRDYRVVLWLLAVLLLSVLILTHTRGGFVSLLGGVGVFVLLRLAQTARITARIAPRWILLGGTLIGVAAVIGYVAYSIPQGTGVSNAGRLDMLEGAVAMTLDYPLTGVGYGQFGHAFRAYRDPTIVQDKLASAHNIYANTAAETGLLGAAAGLALVGLFVWRAWGHWQQAGRGQRVRIEATLAALVGVAVHSMVDMFSVTPIVIMLLLLVAYALTPQPTSRLDVVDAGRRWAAWLALLIFAGYGAWWLLLDAAQARYMQSLDTSTPTRALAEVRAAQQLDPHLGLYVLHEAFLLSFDASVPLAERSAAYERALALEPTWDVGWINLAALAEQQGNPAAASAHLQTAYAINHDNSAGLHWARLNEASDSANADAILSRYRRGINALRYWHLPLSPFWGETPLRRAAVAATAERLPVDERYRILAVHDPAQAATLYATLAAAPQRAADWWVLGEHALAVQGDARGAVAAFSRAIVLEPTRGDYYASRARANLELDPQAAQADLDRAQAIGTQRESTQAIRAQLIPAREARLPLLAAAYTPPPRPQEFAAVRYNRPAVFTVAQAMQHPGPGDAAMQPWHDIAAYYVDVGNVAQARRWYSLILTYAPFDARAAAALIQIQN